jgi:DivIVA domain-containing protein
MAGGLARLARSSREVVVAGDQCGWLPDRVGVDAEVAVGGRAGGGQRGRWVQAVAGEQGDLAGQGAGGVGAGEDRYARAVGQRQQLGQALAQLGDPLPDRSDAFWLRWTTADRVGLHAVPDRAMSRSAASMPVPCSIESTPAYQSRDLAGTPYSYPMQAAFDIVLRGYDRHQVDQLLDRAEQALASGRWYVRKPVLDALRSANFRGD